MKFTLQTVASYYCGDDAEKLKELGFTMTTRLDWYQPICDDGSPAQVKDNSRSLTIEINTLEELAAFGKKYGDIIISFGETPGITIYDDYI